MNLSENCIFKLNVLVMALFMATILFMSPPNMIGLHTLVSILLSSTPCNMGSVPPISMPDSLTFSAQVMPIPSHRQIQWHATPVLFRWRYEPSDFLPPSSRECSAS